MIKTETKILDTQIFFTEVTAKVKEGMPYRDAIQLCAVSTDNSEITRLVSTAINKYQESIYRKTELSQQKNVDECALASMGKLWHGENFEGSLEQMKCTDEENFLDVLYFTLKYAKSENPLVNTLAANEKVCGDKASREIMIKRIFTT